MRKRITKRAEETEENVDKNTVVAEQLVKLAKALLAQENSSDADGASEEEPKFNELRSSIRGKLTKFNKKGILNKRLQSLKDFEAGNMMVSKLRVIDVFELADKILSL